MGKQNVQRNPFGVVEGKRESQGSLFPICQFLCPEKIPLAPILPSASNSRFLLSENAQKGMKNQVWTYKNSFKSLFDRRIQSLNFCPFAMVECLKIVQTKKVNEPSLDVDLVPPQKAPQKKEVGRTDPKKSSLLPAFPLLLHLPIHTSEPEKS